MNTIVYVLATSVDIARTGGSINPNGLLIRLPNGLVVKTLCFSNNVSFLPCNFYHMSFPDAVMQAQPYQVVDSNDWAGVVSNEKMEKRYHFNPKIFGIMSSLSK